MSGRMQCDPHAIDKDRFAPLHTLIISRSQTQFKLAGTGQAMTEIMIAACTRMIAMGMGDDRLVHRPPGIDIKIALCAIKTFIGKCNEGHK